jgi:hypothetical protein
MTVIMMHAMMMKIKLQCKQVYITITNKQTYLQARTTRLPGKQLDSKQQRPEGASVEPRHVHAQPSPFLQIMSSTHAMKSAHERAAYLRPHPASAAVQRQAASSSRRTAPAEGRVSKGSMRRRVAAKAHAMQGSSLPDAAAAAALMSSAAARRTKPHQRHRHDTRTGSGS